MEGKDTSRTGSCRKTQDALLQSRVPQHVANDGSNRRQVLSILFNQ